MRPRIATPVAASLAAVLVLVLVAGCGGGDDGAPTAASTVRAASPVECREFVDIGTPTVQVRNNTPSPLTIENNGVTCAEFSGKGTPKLLNGTVQPGAEVSATLNVRRVEVRWNIQAFSDDVMVPPFMVKLVKSEMTIASSVSGAGFGTRATVGETVSGQPVVAVANGLSLVISIEK